MSDQERYANGQPVGYSNRGLCEKCAGDLGDCNCPPPPADAARVAPADAGLLRFLADDIAHTFQCASQDDACICGAEHHAARLRALAAEREAFAKHDWNRLLGRFRGAIEIGTRWQEIEAENDIRAALGIPLIEPNTQARGDR